MDAVTVTRLAHDERAAHEDVAGRSVVLHYGDVAGEYAALRTSAMLVDRSHRNRMRLDGAKAAELVTGLVTNDVTALTPGQGQYAAALTAKGKIVADIRIFVQENSLLVDVPPRAYAGWSEMVRKYINPRIAPYRDESDTMGDLGVFGALARRMVADVSGVPAPVLGALPLYGHIAALVDGATVTIARVPDLEIEGFELFVPADMLHVLRERLVCQGAVPAGLAAWSRAAVSWSYAPAGRARPDRRDRAMTYAGERVIFDADSHLMELPDFLTAHADPGARELMPQMGSLATGQFNPAAHVGKAGHDPATGKRYALDYNQVFLDPNTGAELGRRYWGAVWPVTRENFVSFLYKLHYTMHIPEFWGSDRWGMRVLGISCMMPRAPTQLFALGSRLISAITWALKMRQSKAGPK